jgi:hypothetical protein
MNDFFHLAVVGPAPARAMGIAAGCTECRQSQPDAPRCNGFGAGCMGFRTPRRDEPRRV